MKKFLIVLTALASLTAASLTLAFNSAYYINDTNTTKAFAVPTTNITVLNYSDRTIFITSPVSYDIPAGTSRTVSRNAYDGYTHISISYNNGSYLSQDVCPRALVIIPNNYIPTFDNRFC